MVELAGRHRRRFSARCHAVTRRGADVFGEFVQLRAQSLPYVRLPIPRAPSHEAYECLSCLEIDGNESYPVRTI